MVAAFTADYMKAVKSRSVAGGVGPRLILRDARVQEERRSSKRQSKES